MGDAERLPFAVDEAGQGRDNAEVSAVGPFVSMAAFRRLSRKPNGPLSAPIETRSSSLPTFARARNNLD